MSESPARLGWHLPGDTLLFAGQGCSVSELRYHSHRGQRQPSCGVHSALETTSGFVCLEMRMWGGSEAQSYTGIIYAFVLEFVLSLFTLHVCTTYPFIIGWNNSKRVKETVRFLQRTKTDFPQWDMVSVFSKFYNDKDKAITKVTPNFNK